MKRDSFIFYRSFFEAARKMESQDRLAYYDALLAYALDDEVLGTSGIADMAMVLVTPQLDANNHRYKNGCLGGRPKKTDGFENKKPMVSENKTDGFEDRKPNVNENENVNDNVNVNDNKDKVAVAPASVIKRFVKPTLLELQQYCQEARLHINCDSFLDYYDAKGWRVGSQPMKDWKAAARNWARRQQEQDKPSADFISRTTFNSDYQNARNKI